MAWTIEYAKTARDQLRKLGKPIARRIAVSRFLSPEGLLVGVSHTPALRDVG